MCVSGCSGKGHAIHDSSLAEKAVHEQAPELGRNSNMSRSQGFPANNNQQEKEQICPLSFWPKHDAKTALLGAWVRSFDKVGEENTAL